MKYFFLHILKKHINFAIRNQRRSHVEDFYRLEISIKKKEISVRSILKM